jgi:hypothetical protein
VMTEHYCDNGSAESVVCDHLTRSAGEKLPKFMWLTATPHALRVPAFVIVGWLATATAVWASCATTDAICPAYDRAAVVFAGDVVSMQPASGPTRSGVVTQVRFKAVERLKGAVAEELTLALQPSSEEFGYAVGQRVLVYASPRGNVWSTACTRTRAVSASDSELDLLRALRDNRPGGNVWGYMSAFEMSAGPVRGLRVTVSRKSGGTTETYTDVHGRFDTPWLDPGTYVLSVSDASGGLIGRREVSLSQTSRCVELRSVRRGPKA